MKETTVTSLRVDPDRFPRLKSIDALRGFDMLWITGGAAVVTALERWLVGRPGWFSRQLDHVAWEGFHFEDLIMPLFMFLAGVSLPFSTAKRLDGGASKLGLWGHALKRAVLLWIFGMAVQGNLLSWDPSKWKFISNTLQAIAAGYLIATGLYLHATLRLRVLASVGLMLATWAVFAWVPAPGGTAGDYTPAGNVAIWLDKLLLGSHQDGTTYAWIVGFLNFGATTMLGVLAGDWLRNPERSGNRKTLGLLAAGVASIALAFAWMPFHPLIKHLWTGSFVLLSGGWSLLLLALFYWVIDVRGWQRGSGFFVVIGANSIAAYMLSHIWSMNMISDRLVAGLGNWLPAEPMALIKAVAAVAVLWLILWHLYRHKVSLKV
jgi:predicted acyltransferase